MMAEPRRKTFEEILAELQRERGRGPTGINAQEATAYNLPMGDAARVEIEGAKRRAATLPLPQNNNTPAQSGGGKSVDLATIITNVKDARQTAGKPRDIPKNERKRIENPQTYSAPTPTMVREPMNRATAGRRRDGVGQAEDRGAQPALHARRGGMEPNGENTVAAAAERKQALDGMGQDELVAFYLNPANKKGAGDSARLGALIKDLEAQKNAYLKENSQAAATEIWDANSKIFQLGQTINKLKMRKSPFHASAAGFVDSFQSKTKPAEKLILNATGDEDGLGRGMLDARKETIAAAREYDPAASTVGYFGGTVAQYQGTKGILKDVPGVNRLLEGVGVAGSNAVGQLGKPGAWLADKFFTPEAVAGLVGDQALDVALDTVPNAVIPGVEKLVQGEEGYTGWDLAGDVGQNFSENALFNLGGELVGQGIDAFKNRGKPKVELPIPGSDADAVVRTLDDAELPHKESVGEMARKIAEDKGLPGMAAQKSTIVDVNPARHTPAEQARVMEYVLAVDDNFAKYVQDFRADPAGVKQPFEFGQVSARQAEDLQKIVPGLDTTGYRQVIQPTELQHIEKRHGAYGKADHSMAHVEDVARMEYVLQNYDEVQPVLRAAGGQKTTRVARNTGGTQAPMVRYSKAINGTYYVVEAVPDNEAKTLKVVSAYIEKNKKGGKMPPNEPGLVLNGNEAPSLTSETVPALDTNNSIPPSGAKSNDMALPIPGKNGAPPAREVPGLPLPGDEPLGVVNREVMDSTTGLRRMGRKAYQQTVSGQAPLERAAKLQNKIDAGKADLNDLSQQVRNAGGTVDYIAEKALVDRSGAEMGPSWKKMMEGSPDELKVLNEYRFNKHNIDRLKQNKPVLESTAEQSAKRIKELEAQYPGIAGRNEALTRYHDQFMEEWAVKGNLMSKEKLEQLRQMYPDYAPTYRVDNTGAKGGGGRISMEGQRRKDVQGYRESPGAVGSVEELVPLEDSMMAQMNKLVRSERKNELLLDLYNFAEKHPIEASGFARIMKPDADNLKTLYDGGLDRFIDSVDELAIKQINKGEYVATVFKDGKPVQMAVSEDIFDGLKHLFGNYYDKTTQLLMDVGHAATAVPKTLITGSNPFFALRNIVRDFQTGYVNSITDRKLFVTYVADVVGSAKDIKNKVPDYQLFRANGGNRSGIYSNERGFSKSVTPPRTTAGKIWEGTKKVANSLGVPGEKSEELVRYAEFKSGLKKYGRSPDGIKKAMQASADVTTNFARNGPLVKAVDSTVMYLNASVQGLDKIVRTLKANPGRTLRRAAEMITLPTVFLWFANRNNPHYQELNDRTKDSSYIIPNMADLDEDGNARTFIKIPKSREWGAVMGAVFERAGRLLDGETPEEAFSGLGDAFMDNYGLANPATENALAPLYYNLATNKDFAGRSIVPESMKDLPKQYQYDYTTSWPAKKLGERLGASPKQLDYLFDQYGGFVADIVQPATNESNKSALEIATSPITNAFTANPAYSSKSSDKLYDALDEATAEAKGRNFAENLPAELLTPEEVYQRELSRATTAISDLRKQEHLLNQADISRAERVEQTRALRQQQTDLARDALPKAQEYLVAYKALYEPALAQLEGGGAMEGMDEKQAATARKFISSFADEVTAANHGGEEEMSEWVKRAYDDAQAAGKDPAQVAAEYAVVKATSESSGTKVLDAYNAGIAPQTYDAYREKAGEGGKTRSAQALLSLELKGQELYDMYMLHNSTDTKMPALYDAGVRPESYLRYVDLASMQGGGSLSQPVLAETLLKAPITEKERELIYKAEKPDGFDMAAARQSGVGGDMVLQYLKAADTDGNGSIKQAEAEAALLGLELNREQRAAMFALTNKTWKKNPFR